MDICDCERCHPEYYTKERGQELAKLRDIAAHTNRRKHSRTKRKREAMKQEDKDER